MPGSGGIQLGEVLRPEHVVVPLQAETLREAVRVLVDRLVATGDVAHPNRLERLLTGEETRDTIRVGERVLLPHLRTDAVSTLVVAIGIASQPLRTAAKEDTGGARIVVLVLSPPSAANLYLRTVAALARALRQDDVVDQLSAATSGEAVLAFAALTQLSVQPRLTVRDVMTPRVYRVTPETPIGELMDLMIRHDLNAVPVVGPKREILGLVTERDLLRHLLPRIAPASSGDAISRTPPALDTPVREIMARSVMCISEDQALTDVASIMINKDVARVPVVSEGQLTGFLTRGDIIRKLFGR